MSVTTNRQIIATTKFGKSMTLPDQSYTVKELFQRFRKGLPIKASQSEPIWAGEENEVDLEKVSRMSRMDKADLSAELAEQNAAQEEQILSEKKQRAEERKKKAQQQQQQNPPEPGAKTGLEEPKA